VAEERQRWQPLSRAEFRQLERDQQLRERRGRVWIVHVAPHERDGLAKVVLRSGDLVRHVDERYADDYALLDEENTPTQ
jgi:hypothetical protein